jgi:hypothetical protein
LKLDENVNATLTIMFPARIIVSKPIIAAIEADREGTRNIEERQNHREAGNGK